MIMALILLKRRFCAVVVDSAFAAAILATVLVLWKGLKQIPPEALVGVLGENVGFFVQAVEVLSLPAIVVFVVLGLFYVCGTRESSGISMVAGYWFYAVVVATACYFPRNISCYVGGFFRGCCGVRVVVFVAGCLCRRGVIVDHASDVGNYGMWYCICRGGIGESVAGNDGGAHPC
jgi:hypothetical protein